MPFPAQEWLNSPIAEIALPGIMQHPSRAIPGYPVSCVSAGWARGAAPLPRVWSNSPRPGAHCCSGSRAGFGERSRWAELLSTRGKSSPEDVSLCWDDPAALGCALSQPAAALWASPSSSQVLWKCNKLIHEKRTKMGSLIKEVKSNQ